MSNGKAWDPREKASGPRDDRGSSRLPTPGKRTLTEGLVHSSADARGEAGAPMQAKRGGAAAASTPASGGPGSPLPDRLRAQMESSMGTDFSSVRVHEGPRASSIGALAYTQNTDIHFAPGQYDPASQGGQELIGHELAHVVQQAQGRVAPTAQAKGAAINNEPALEREADEVGTKAARGEPAQIGGANADNTLPSISLAAGLTQRAAIQRTQDPATCSSETGSLDNSSSGDDVLGCHLAALQQAQNTSQRQAANTTLVEWCRQHLVDGAQLQELLGSALDAAEKTRILGELRVAIARNEFLLGWSYEGGVTSGGTNGWENSGINRGAYPSYYMDEVETYNRQNGSPWCTSFAGHTATRLGFEASPGEDETSMFWSGYRLDTWAREGRTNSGTQVTPEAQRVAAGGGGSARIGGDVWAILYGELNQLHESRPPGQSDEAFQESLAQAVDNFFCNNPVPQAGDMLVYDSNNAIVDGSHTNMVERYDATTHTIYTIGGNEGDAVGGRRVVLTDRAQVRRLATMVRIGAEFYTGGQAAGGAAAAGGSGTAGETVPPGGPAAVGEPVTAGGAGATCLPPMTADEGAAIGAELLSNARTINQRISNVMYCLGQLQSDNPDASVLELQTGGTATNASATDQ